jgi:HAD superfamily hydrolase (TIGR01509 family)
MPGGVLFDVDGTLVDTNYLHTVAWWDAFRSQHHDVAMSRLHGLIGQGSDRLVESVLGAGDDAISDAHTDFYGARLHDLRAFDGAADLLRAVKASGLRVLLATSASAKEAEHLRAAIGADDVIDLVTTKDDAESSKPAPDIVETAMARNGLAPADCVFVGDTVWDVEAASRAGLECVCVLTGGISETELREAGATAVYTDVAQLLAELADSPLGRLADRLTG